MNTRAARPALQYLPGWDTREVSQHQE